jgi:hypothetical protein
MATAPENLPALPIIGYEVTEMRSASPLRLSIQKVIKYGT